MENKLNYKEKVLSGRKEILKLFTKEELISIIIEKEDTITSFIDSLTPKIKL